MSLFNFDPDLYLVKCNPMNSNEIICGFVFKKNEKYFLQDEKTKEEILINHYVISRNTGIKIKSFFIFEGDIVCTEKDKKVFGVVIWDDFLRGWAVQSNINFSGRSEINKVSIYSVAGNILLSDSDMKMFQEYSDSEEKKGYSKKITDCQSSFGKKQLEQCDRNFFPIKNKA